MSSKSPSSSPLKIVREARTFTQEEMARLVGVTQGTWSQYEAGTVTPPVHRQVAIAAKLGVSVEDLFGQTPEPV